ncbi:32177_t:CDS:2, partial [Gigaspora margarita]
PDIIESFKHIRHFDPIVIVTIGQTKNNSSNFISVRSMSFKQPSTTEYSKVENLFLKLKAQKDAFNHVKDVEIDDSYEGHENETNEPFEWSDNVNSGLGGNIPNVKLSLKVIKNLEEHGKKEENPGKGGGVAPSRYKTEQILVFKVDLGNCGITKFL